MGNSCCQRELVHAFKDLRCISMERRSDPHCAGAYVRMNTGPLTTHYPMVNKEDPCIIVRNAKGLEDLDQNNSGLGPFFKSAKWDEALAAMGGEDEHHEE